MAKGRRRSKAQRIEARMERTLRGHDSQLIEVLQATIAEHERRRFWLRLGCPVGPIRS